jgi:hypothetical protein
MAHELQTRYAKLVDAKYRATLTTKDNVIFNTKYEGSPTAGVVKIAVPNEIEVRDYDRENGGSLTASSTSYITVEINEDIYINEKVDYASDAWSLAGGKSALPGTYRELFAKDEQLDATFLVNADYTIGDNITLGGVVGYNYNQIVHSDLDSYLYGLNKVDKIVKKLENFIEEINNNCNKKNQ